MAQYKKKAIVIEAIQWNGSEQSWNDITVMGCVPQQDEICGINEIIIPTLEDGSKSQVKHVATIGDYIIKGIDGEFYPCKPDIFAKTYDLLTMGTSVAYMENVRKVAEEMAVAHWNEHKSNGTLRYEQLATHIQEGAIKKMTQCARIAVRLQTESVRDFAGNYSNYAMSDTENHLIERGLIPLPENE